MMWDLKAVDTEEGGVGECVCIPKHIQMTTFPEPGCPTQELHD